MLELKVKKTHQDAILPTIGTNGSACFDIYALEDIEFLPGEIKLIRTGICLQAPKKFRLNLYLRSSTPLNKKFILANSVGIIDSDYVDEIKIQLMNINIGYQQINYGQFINNKIIKGTKIAQCELVANTLAKNFKIVLVNDIPKTTRNGGFGSTDV